MAMYSPLILIFLLIASAQSLQVPEFNYTRHPLRKPPHNVRVKSVIMQSYIIRVQDNIRTSGLMFAPLSAAYKFSNTTVTLDALYVPPDFRRRANFLEFRLNAPARVFLVLETRKMESGTNFTRISGLSNIWTHRQSTQSATGDPIRVASQSRHIEYFLPKIGAVVERTVQGGEYVTVPSSTSISVDGHTVIGYSVLFAMPGEAGSIPKPCPYPSTPSSIRNRFTGRPFKPKPVVPNEQCPDWLHDIYTAPSRDLAVAEALNEPTEWGTWHPLIDPVYWCYFGHEHGSYPGNYAPLFQYTAWKTPDNSTTNGRQDESDQGFKVFTIPLPNQRRFVVFTVHIQGSSARRFRIRHHTIIVAVLDENWKLEMELSMKLDFGFAAAELANKTQIPLNGAQRAILNEIESKGGSLRRRIFNVINLNNYPHEVDNRFRFRGGVKPTKENEEQVSSGVYERWTGALNTCSGSSRSTKRVTALTFDLRQVATGLRKMEDDSEAGKQELLGDSIDRRVKIPESFGDVLIGVKHCLFENGKLNETDAQEGVFYTDAYFGKVLKDKGRNSVRQFIKRGFEDVRLATGRYAVVSSWFGAYHMQKGKESRMRHTNVEAAVLKTEN